MKPKHLLAACTLLLAACTGKGGDEVILTANINGLGNDTLFLYGTEEFYSRIDTLVARKDKFTATLHTDTLVPVRLLFANGKEYPLLINKGDRLTLKGDTSRLDRLQVSGSKPNEELTAFYVEIEQLSASSSLPIDTLLRQRADSFIVRHPASMASLLLLERYFMQSPQPDFARMKQLVDPMTGELKDRVIVDKLLKEIEVSEKVKRGRLAPYFNLPNQKGESINRNSFKDKYLLVNFWASWDAASAAANDSLRALYRKEKNNKHFAMWGISLDMDKTMWKEAVKRDSLLWEQSCDFNGWETLPAKQLAIQVLPANILISPSGRIEGCNLTKQELEQRLEKITKEEKEKSLLKKNGVKSGVRNNAKRKN